MPYFIYYRLLQRLQRTIPAKTPENVLVNYLKLQKIDVVLIQYGTLGAKLSAVIAKTGIPMVVHFHGYDAYQHDIIKRNKEGYAQMFQNARVLIVVSEHMRRRLLSLGAPDSKIVVNRYLPQPHFANTQSSLQSNNILFVGRFVDKKAPYLTLAAFKEVAKEMPSAKLIMAGSGGKYGGYLEETVARLARYWNISDKVEILGNVSHHQISELMRDSCCYMQHSVTSHAGDSEGTPNAILEAMLVGLPVVSTNHTGIPEIITHGKTGYTVEEGDVSGMAEYVKCLLNDKTLAKKLGKAAREFILTHVKEDSYLSNLNDCLRRVHATSGVRKPQDVNNKTYVDQLRRNQLPLRLNIGSGRDIYDQWICMDIDDLDITKEEDWVRYFQEGDIDMILAEHVWEHLDLEDTKRANQHCLKYLKPGGKLRLAVPDGNFDSVDYIEHVKPGGIGPGAGDHKNLYDYKSMVSTLKSAGFNVNLLEYWDDNGQFQRLDWDVHNGGMIKRSYDYDVRNVGGVLRYTSLIVDAIKPLELE
ncbi:MAG: glycosyltransferase [Cytophagales bacterium]